MKQSLYKDSPVRVLHFQTVKWNDYLFTQPNILVCNFIQLNPFSIGHEIFKIVILVVRMLSVQLSEVSGMLFETHISLFVFRLSWRQKKKHSRNQKENSTIKKTAMVFASAGFKCFMINKNQHNLFIPQFSEAHLSFFS